MHLSAVSVSAVSEVETIEVVSVTYSAVEATTMRHFRYLILVLISTSLGCTADNWESRIDEQLSAYKSPQPGIALRIIEGDEVRLERTIGFAVVGTEVPVTANTNFRLASITKHFTALSILLLIDEGKLELDTPLASIIPEFPSYAEDITIRQLLQHQAGLPDYEPLVPDGTVPRVRDREVVNLLIQQSSLDFAPGSQYYYSNSAYAVLAIIVEELSGLTFEEFLRARIFEPSNMNNTVALVEGINTVPSRAMGHTVLDGSIEETDQSDFSAVLGDGGIYSSLEDMTTWVEHDFGKQLLSLASYQAIFIPDRKNYGLGWRIDEFSGHVRYHHSGSTRGFRNFIAHLPDSDITLILLSNRGAPDVKPLGEAILDEYLKHRASN